MAPHFKVAEARKTNGVTSVKRTVKYLSVCRDPQIRQLILRRAPDGVVKSICNAALNVERGDVNIPQADRKLFARNRKRIAFLTSRNISLKKKRQALVQKGGFPFLALLPKLLGPVISTLGSLFFNTGNSNQQQD